MKAQLLHQERVRNAMFKAIGEIRHHLLWMSSHPGET